jgi:hypothetical protein
LITWDISCLAAVKYSFSVTWSLIDMGKFNDSPYFLDIFYRSFDKDIEYMGQDYGHTRYYTTKVLDLEKHNICEEFELQFESSWRGDFLKDSKKAAPVERFMLSKGI